MVSLPCGWGGVAPEAGVSYWLDKSTRLNAGVSYYVVPNQPEFLVFGASIDYVLGDGLPFADWMAQKDPRIP
jgi:hypothetical protein